jgi:molybdopterin-containing oxidoreductase family membrane subunit
VRYDWAFFTWIGILAILVVAGLYSFYRQTFEGHYLTGLTDATPWGLYIAGFVFFVGTSAGATIVGLLIHAFGRQEYAPLGTRAILVGLLSLAAAVLFIVVHVGSIPRTLLLPWVWRSSTSMFTYTSITYYVFGLMLLAELYLAVRITRGLANARDRWIAKWLAIAAVPFALMVLHAPHGALFAVLIAREFWNNPLLPPHFAAVALVSGTALVLLVAIITSGLQGRAIVTRPTLAHMGMLLAFFIAITGFFDFFDLVVFAYSDRLEGGEARHFLTTTHLPLSILQVFGYLFAFVVLLFRWGRTTPWLAAASVAALLAVAAYRYNLVTVGISIPLYPFVQHVHYRPTLSEGLVAAGIVAGMLLAYAVATKLLPMEERASSLGSQGYSAGAGLRF